MPTNFVGKYRDKWTRIYAKLRYGGVKEVAPVSSRSGNHTVYWVSSESAYIGQKTPGAETIIINRARYSELSDLSADRIIEHELGHRKRHPVLRGALWGAVISAAIGLAMLLLLGLILALTSATIASNLELIFVLIGMIALAPIAVRLDELAAELHVLNHMTEDEYLMAVEQMPELDEIPIVLVGVGKLLYPNPESVVRVHRVKEKLRAS